jgi:predicted transcriptional regulator
MRVADLMSRAVVCCDSTKSLVEPAKAMWDQDVGFIPIVAPKTGVLEGVVTDRDICMAAMTKGKPLHEIPVRDVMQTNFYACSEGDHIARIHSIMRDHRLRRVPVLNAEQQVVGVVALNDLACHADTTASKGLRDAFIKTIGAICRPHLLEKKHGWPRGAKAEVVGA